MSLELDGSFDFETGTVTMSVQFLSALKHLLILVVLSLTFPL